MARSERAFAPTPARPRTPSERGASAVEFALVLLPLCYIVFGIISYGMMLSFRQTLSQATAEGARAAAVQLNASKQASSAQDAVNDALSAVRVNGDALACGVDGVTCVVTPAFTCDTASCITVTVSYPYKDHPLVPALFLPLPGHLTYSATVRVS